MRKNRLKEVEQLAGLYNKEQLKIEQSSTRASNMLQRNAVATVGNESGGRMIGPEAEKNPCQLRQTTIGTVSVNRIPTLTRHRHPL